MVVLKMGKFKIIKIILLNLSILFYHTSYQLEYIYINISETAFLGGKVTILLICDICIILAIIILLVIIILILVLEKNELKTLIIIEIVLINLTMLCYLGSHLLEPLALYVANACITVIKMPMNTLCNICFVLSIVIPLIVICLIIFERKTKVKKSMMN